MFYSDSIEGRFVKLKPVDIDDAEFTLSIRQDPKMTKYLPRLDITLKQQQSWIQQQRQKEGDYFFVVISKKSGKRIGTVGIYDVEGKSGEGGRFALYGELHEKIEAGILMGEFEFNILNLDSVTGWVYVDNSPAIKWNRQFGAIFGEPYKYEDGKDVFNFVIDKKRSEAARAKLKKILERIRVD